MSAPGGASAAEPAAGEAGAGEEKGVDITKMSIEDLQKNLTVLNEVRGARRLRARPSAAVGDDRRGGGCAGAAAH